MPRQTLVDRDSLLQSSELQHGQIATPAASVWKHLGQQLEDKMSAKALDTSVKLTRHNIWSPLDSRELEGDPGGPVDAALDSGFISPGLKERQAFQPEEPLEEWV